MMRADGIARLAAEELDAGLQQILKPTMERLGYLGEFFSVAGHVPDAVPAFMQYMRVVKAPLSDPQNELLALAVCASLGADYERIQHERLALRLGSTPAWIAAATGRPEADPAALAPDERLLRSLALAVVSRNGEHCASEIRAVVEAIGTVKGVAALLQVTRFISIALMCNALSLELPVASIFDEAAGRS